MTGGRCSSSNLGIRAGITRKTARISPWRGTCSRESGRCRDDVGEVHLPALGELRVAPLAEEPARDLVHVVGGQHVQVVLILEVAEDSEDRARVGLEV